jgi:asparagine N-glycosylation enzyme membrane subunit Stt3
MLEADGRFEDPDAMFHAHRVERTIAEGKLLPPVFDPYENFPDGGRAVWPPLHDATLSLLARLGGSTAAEPRRGLPLAAALPPAEVALAVLAAAALARRAGGPKGGVAAAWLLALTPCVAWRGAFGEIDHNLTEVLGALLLVLLAGAIVRREESAGTGLSDPRLSPLLWASGVLLALGFYTGLVLSAGIAAAAVAAHDLVAPARRALPRLSLGFGLAALALPLFASLRVTPDPGDPWRLGPTYVLVLAIGAVGSGLFALALSARRGFSKDPDLSSAAGVVAGAAAMLTTSSRAWPALATAFGFLGSRDPWLATINEFRPLYRMPSVAETALPAGVVAVVAVVLLLAYGGKRQLETAPAFVVAGVPFALFALITLAESRFLSLAVAFGAAAGGAAWSLLSARRGIRAALWSVAVLGFLPVSTGNLIPSVATTLLRNAYPNVMPSEIAAAAIAATTPDPGNPPAWGVLAWWDYGHPIVYRGRRAVALNNFGSGHPGFRRATRLLLETSPSAAVAALSDLRLRYVVAAWPPDVLPSAATALGEDPAAYLAEGRRSDGPPAYGLTPKGERTLAARLHLRDGRPFDEDSAADREALGRFRLVTATEETVPGTAGPIPRLKIFELLPAATPSEAPSSASR